MIVQSVGMRAPVVEPVDASAADVGDPHDTLRHVGANCALVVRDRWNLFQAWDVVSFGQVGVNVPEPTLRARAE